MANKKIKAEVHINDAPGMSVIELELTPAQATSVLERIVSGETLNINLVTNGKPVQKDFDYSS